MQPNQRPVVSIIGWHGKQNAGDDAFCAVLSEWALQQLDVSRIQVTGATECLPCTELSRPVKPEGLIGKQRASRLKRLLREPGFIFGKDFVVFGAGSIFSVRRFAWLAMQLYLLRFLRFLRLMNTRVGAVGVSIGPFRNSSDKKWCGRVLRLFDVVMVRDQKSYEIGKEFGIKNLIASYDLALALPHYFTINKKPEVSNEQVKAIGFSLVDRDTEHGNPEPDIGKNNALFEAMKKVGQENRQTKFRGFVFCNDERRGDLETTRAMLDRLSAEGFEVELVEYKSDPIELIQEVAAIDVMICNRMHSFVFSCLTETPAVMISYAPKMVEFAKTVSVPDNLQFSHTDISPVELAEQLSKLLKRPEQACDDIKLLDCSGAVVRHMEQAAGLLRK